MRLQTAMPCPSDGLFFFPLPFREEQVTSIVPVTWLERGQAPAGSG